ncbi:MAG: polymerase delta subunit [Gemmatimonadetes bacterium]|nr:polymerase delta subunit [Gemmatimonadota bacterium]
MPRTVSSVVPLLPLLGHGALVDRLVESAAAGTLPASLLLHGPRGVGKQRVALELAQALLCEGSTRKPCGACQQCRFAMQLVHPDIHWYFPQERKEVEDTPDVVRKQYRDWQAERGANGGLYAPPSGSTGLFVEATKAIVLSATLSPAMAKRKVFIIGDADRMISQEGADQAANAFLKLLEEPPDDTTLIITSSEPGGLLPTIRSRVVSMRVPPISDQLVSQFFDDEHVQKWLKKPDKEAGMKMGRAERIERAHGAPGELLAQPQKQAARDRAERLMSAIRKGDRAELIRAAFAQGTSGARGPYADTLDALTELLRDMARDAVSRNDQHVALGAARAVNRVEMAKERASNNANPQLVTQALLRDIGGMLA